MNEPTVLDYVKSIFKDWKSFAAFLRAWSQHADTASLIETPAVEGAPAPDVERSTFSLQHFALPWRSLLALLLGLTAQRLFEPPMRSALVGVPLYLAALALALWAFRRGELSPAPLPASEEHTDPLTVRGFALLLAVVYGIAAFYMMGSNFITDTPSNTFTLLNLGLLAVTLILFLRAFWLKAPQSLWRRLAASLGRFQWDRRAALWFSLAAGALVLTLFFRFYHLSTVVPEMTSDHAEKLEDVLDIARGKYSIFFERNTGREPLYIYLSALLTPFFGVSFLDIKVAAVIGGLAMLPYLYLLGKEMGSPRIGLLAVAFAGIAYWPNVIERFALRISFYPLFVAPTLYYLIRGLRRQQRNDFILAGLALGLGLNGYTPFRIMPFVVVILVGLYLLHVREKTVRKQTALWLVLLALTSFIIFIPLARYALEFPDKFGFRALSRLGSVERPLPGPAWQLFLGNLWNSLKQFNWDNGNAWVHSIPYRPALDVVSGALFLLGAALLTARYVRSRQWQDLVLLVSVPLTQMPSILSLAFPVENPSMNRAAGAIVPVFLFVGIGLDGLISAWGSEKKRAAAGWALAGVLFIASSLQNYNLVFRQYNDQYIRSSWNTSEMGAVMKSAMQRGVPAENVWIVPYPYWVDTRLPPIWAGVPGPDIAVPREELAKTLETPGPKVFMVKIDDLETLNLLQSLYPSGALQVYDSYIDDAYNFWTLSVP